MTNGTDSNGLEPQPADGSTEPQRDDAVTESAPAVPESVVPNATVYTPGAAPAPYGAAETSSHATTAAAAPAATTALPTPTSLATPVTQTAESIGGSFAASAGRRTLPLAATVAIAALVGGGVGAGVVGATWSLTSSSSSVTRSAAAQNVTINDTTSVSTVSAVAAKALPSVVTMSVTSGSSGGTGSGVVISADGYIVTNTHVVTLDGASSSGTISVVTSDGRQFTGKLIGTDPNSDLAVVKIDATGLQPIEFANSDALNVGALTIAIGAPMELSNTVTQGIISALYRGIEIASSAAPSDSGAQSDGSGDSSPFQFWNYNQKPQGSGGSTGNIALSVIQTDAAINPGNSGGALLDGTGKLIGINVAILSGGSSQSSGTAGNIGIGFAIPANQVERVAKEIIATGTATHGLLGASVTSTDSKSTERGAVVKEVTPGGAAAAAGIRPDDIITQFNGIRVRDQIDLTALVRSQAAGAQATLVVVRNGAEQSVSVTLGTFSG